MNDLGWHFTLGDKLRDGRPIPKVGEVLRHEGPIEICRSGLHCSERLIDALRHAPGATLHQVRFGVDVLRESDKLVSRERVILRTLPQNETLLVLVEFAQWCAQRAAAWTASARWVAVTWAARAAAWTAEAAEAGAGETAAAKAAVAAAEAMEAAEAAAEEAARTAQVAEMEVMVAEMEVMAAEMEVMAAVTAAAEAERGLQNTKLTELVERAFAALEMPTRANK